MTECSKIIGNQLNCGRKIKGEKFVKTTKENPIYFKTPKLKKGKYPKKVKYVIFRHCYVKNLLFYDPFFKNSVRLK